MAIDDGDVLRVVIDHILADDTVTNLIFHFLASFQEQSANGPVLNALEEFIENFYTAVADEIDDGSALGPMDCNKVEFNETTQQWEVTEFIGTRYPSVTFAGSGDQLPNQTAAVLVADTTRPKSFGKKFIAGFVELASQGSVLIASALAALADALVYYVSDIEVATGLNLVAGVPRTHSDVFLPFTTGFVDYIVGSQRRRKPGVGE
jgi:hypothetical protein